MSSQPDKKQAPANQSEGATNGTKQNDDKDTLPKFWRLTNQDEIMCIVKVKPVGKERESRVIFRMWTHRGHFVCLFVYNSSLAPSAVISLNLPHKYYKLVNSKRIDKDIRQHNDPDPSRIEAEDKKREKHTQVRDANIAL